MLRWALSCQPAKLLGCQTKKKRTEETEREGDKKKKVWHWEELYASIRMAYQVHFQDWSYKIKTHSQEQKTWVKCLNSTQATSRKGINRNWLALMEKYAVNSTDGWAHFLSNSLVFFQIIWSWDGSRREGGWLSVCWKCCSYSTSLYLEKNKALPRATLLSVKLYMCTCTQTHTQKIVVHIKKDQFAGRI